MNHFAFGPQNKNGENIGFDQIWSNLIKFDIFKMFLNCDEFVWNHLWKTWNKLQGPCQKVCLFQTTDINYLDKMYFLSLPCPKSQWNLNWNECECFFWFGYPSHNMLCGPLQCPFVKSQPWDLLWFQWTQTLKLKSLQNSCNLLARLLQQTKGPQPFSTTFSFFHPCWNGCMVLYNMHEPCDGAMGLEKHVKVLWTMGSMVIVSLWIHAWGNTKHGTNTKLLKYPGKPFWQGLLEIKKNMQNAWMGRQPTLLTRVAWQLATWRT